MYNSKVNKDNYNVSIDGYDLIAESFNANEAYNRRETGRKNIIGGTQAVIRTNYIHRDYSFTTHLLIDPLYPDVYDDLFREWMSKPVEVISKHMGGKFNAEVIVKKLNDKVSPNYLSIEIQVLEIPDVESLIPNDKFKSPANKKSKVTVKSTKGKNKNKNKNSKGKGKTSKGKGKTGKKKTTKNKNSKGKGKTSKGKTKGNNITKTK